MFISENRLGTHALCQKIPALLPAIEFMYEFEDKFPDGEIFMVGGAVRDIILDRAPKDIDFATNVPVVEIEKEFECHDIGKSKEFGIVTVSYGKTKVQKIKQQYEVANYREDQFSEDSNGRHPDGVVLAQTLEQDVLRRDLTINGLAMDSNGRIHDYVGGLNDIKEKVIKFIGDPIERIKEDALRLLRAVRFELRYEGFYYESDTEDAIVENAKLLNNVSRERIYKELLDICKQTPKPINYIMQELREMGLFKYILPIDMDVIEMPEVEMDHCKIPVGKLAELDGSMLENYAKLRLSQIMAYMWNGFDDAKQMMTMMKLPKDVINPAMTLIKTATMIDKSCQYDDNGEYSVIRDLIDYELLYKADIFGWDVSIHDNKDNALKYYVAPNTLDSAQCITLMLMLKMLRGSDSSEEELLDVCQFLDNFRHREENFKYSGGILRGGRHICGDTISRVTGMEPGKEFGDLLKFVKKTRLHLIIDKHLDIDEAHYFCMGYLCAKGNKNNIDCV